MTLQTISTVIIVLSFISLVVILMLEKIHRVIISIISALVCFFVIVYIEKLGFQTIVEYMFGTPEDNFVNLHSLLLIFGMSIIVQICNKAGVFKFISFRLVLTVIDRIELLLLILCVITVILSALLNNILTVMIMIPLIITISRILNIDPEPYIVTQAVLVNIGGTVFAISSIPNILITGFAEITFNQYFINVGLFSILVFMVTVGFFYVLYYGKLSVEKENIKILKEFNPWNFVQNRSLLIKSSLVLLLVIFSFIIIPASIVSPDIIAMVGAMFLVLISKLDIDKIVEQFEMDIFIYLLGVFVVAGALEETGILNIVGNFLAKISGGNYFVAVLLILWISAFLSSTVDNIPITQVLIPSIGVIVGTFVNIDPNLGYYSLAFGANWGDNLTPMGDNILVMNLAEKNKRPIRMREFWRVGFLTTLYQLVLATVYFSLRMSLVIGLILLIITIISSFLLVIWWISKKKGIKFSEFMLEKSKSREKN